MKPSHTSAAVSVIAPPTPARKTFGTPTRSTTAADGVNIGVISVWR